MHAETVAPARDRCDGVGADQLAQAAHLHRQVAFLDDGIRPHQVKELILGDEPTGSLGQYQKQVEGTTADGDAPPADHESSLEWQQLAGPEAQQAGPKGDGLVRQQGLGRQGRTTSLPRLGTFRNA
jgi:hypothetical protein